MVGVIAFLALSVTTELKAFDLGVGTHFGQNRGDETRLLRWLEASGFTSFRDEIYWSQVEAKPGQFALSAAAERSFRAFEKAGHAGLSPLVVLGYGNRHYDGASQPASNEAIEAFAAYAEWVVSSLRDRVYLFEVWNEWNIGAGRRPAHRYGSPSSYVNLLRATFTRVRKANSSAKIIAGGVGDDFPDWKWVREVVKAGILSYADGVSVHIYNHSMRPADVGAGEVVMRLQRLQSLLREANEGKPVPIYLTETGWPAHRGQYGLPDSVVSEHAARLLLEIKTVPDVAGVWWYEFLDSGDDESSREHRFGLFSKAYQEKPSGCRLRSLGPIAKTAAPVAYFGHANAIARIFQIEDGRRMVGVWRARGVAGEPDKVVLKGRFAETSLYADSCGDRTSDASFADQTTEAIQLEVGDFPILFWLGESDSIYSIEST